MSCLRTIPMIFALLCLGAGLTACGGGGGGGAGPVKPTVLYMHTAGSDAEVSDTLDKVAQTGLFQRVDAFNAQFQRPDAATLNSYDVVLFAAFFHYGDEEGLGDLLVDFMNQGGGVVLAMSAQQVQPAGRFESDGYRLVGTAASSRTLRNGAMIVHMPDHPIFTGVSTFSGGESSKTLESTSVRPGSLVLATWDEPDTRALVVADVRNGARRVDLLFLPFTTNGSADGVDPSTDAMRLVANALLWAAGGS